MAVQTVAGAPGAVSEPQPRRYLVFGIVSIALFMASVDQTIVATALGTLQKDLHAPVNWSSWTITVYALGQILVMPLAGRISDQYGRHRVFIGAVALFTAASLACGLANDIYTLVALRAVQSIGGGAFMPSATGIVADQFGPERDRAIGLFTSIFPIGGIVGPILGGVFVTYFSWRWIFLVNVPIGITLFVLALAFVPRSVTRTGGRFDVTGVALLGTGLLGLMLAISYLGENGATLGSVLFIAPLLVGVGALVWFVRHSTHIADPFVPLRLLRGNGFAALNVMNFFYGVAVLGFGALVPLYAEERYGLHILEAGTLLTARAVGMIAVSGLVTFSLRRVGYRLPIVGGFVIGAIGLALLAVPDIGGPYVWLSIAAGITGVGLGMATPATNNAVLQLAPEHTAAVAGLRGMFRQSGGITGISIVTAIIARSNDPAHTQAWVFVVFAVILVLLTPLVRLVPEHKGGW